MNAKKQSVIFDNGTGWFKAGFSENYSPHVVFPTIVGEPKNPNLMVGMDQKDFYVGNEAHAKLSLLKISNPMQKGVIQVPLLTRTGTR